MQRTGQARAHGIARLRRAAHTPAPAKPIAAAAPITVLGLGPPPDRRSSLRSTLPSTTAVVVSLVVLAGLLVLVVAAVEVVDVVDVAPDAALSPAAVDGALSAGTVVGVAALLGVPIAALGCSVSAGGDETAAGGATTVGAAPACDVGVVAVVGADVAAVVGAGAGSAGVPQSAVLNGLGASPAMRAGGASPGEGVVPPTLFNANDQPSVDPGGGLRDPGPRVL